MSDLRSRLNAIKGVAPAITERPGLSTMAEYQANIDASRLAAIEARDRARDEAVEAEWNSKLEKAEHIEAEVEVFIDSRRKGQGIRRGGSLLVQVTDVHFGGTVKGLEEREDANEYCLEKAAHRLAVYAEEILFYGAAHGCEELVIAFTGDIFDSKVGKERKDKMLHAEGTACSAYLKGRDLIRQFIDTFRASELFGSITLCGIAGNEARLYDDRGHGHITASENWDSLLNADLCAWYAGSDVDLKMRVNRCVVEVQGWKVLLLHGDQAIDKNLSQTRCYSVLAQHKADFGISGHIHSGLVTPYWVRSASLIGTDAYAGDGLALDGMASQTIFWLRPGKRNTIQVDLQNPDEDIEPFKVFDYDGAFGSAA